jgi:hypothetical protein
MADLLQQMCGLPPARVVPLGIDREGAEATMRRWLGRGSWRSGDLAERAAVTTMTAVYVPYWVFTAKTFTYWTADSSQVSFAASGDWVPMSGEHRGSYSGLLVGASSVLTPGETSALCPFDLARAMPTNQVDLENVIVEQFLVQRKYARPLARQGLEDLERAACTRYVPGENRSLKVNVRLEGLSSEPVLLPIWVMAYRYQDQVFRFLINGQTGKATGQAPSSWKKIFVVILITILILLMLLGCLGVGGAIINAAAGDRAPPSAASRPLFIMGKAKLPADAPIREQLVFGKQTSSNQRFVEHLCGQHQGASVPDDLHFHSVKEPRATVRCDTRLHGPQPQVKSLDQQERNRDVAVESRINEELNRFREIFVEDLHLDAGFEVFVDATRNHGSCPTQRASNAAGYPIRSISTCASGRRAHKRSLAIAASLATS